MVRLARERSSRYPNIAFNIGDAMTKDLGQEQFDGIASIATLHHLPFDEILSKMKRAPKPGGTLLVLDLFKSKAYPIR